MFVWKSKKEKNDEMKANTKKKKNHRKNLSDSSMRRSKREEKFNVNTVKAIRKA